MAANGEHMDMDHLPTELRERIQQVITNFQDRPKPRIALVGRTGVGKSSCVNMLLGLTDDDEGAAPIGIFGETQTERRVYTYFGIDFEDLPGSDGVFQDLPLGEAYVRAMELHTADAILLLWERSLCRALADCASLLVNRYGRPVFFIRTCMDRNADEAFSRGLADSDEEVMQAVRQRAQREIERLGLTNLTDGRLFFISAKILHKHRFDCPRLLEQIASSIRDEAAATRIRGLFTTSLDEFIVGAEKRCRSMIPYYCIAAGSAGIVPVPGTGVALSSTFVVKATYAFLKEFGLTSEAFPYQEWARACRFLATALAAKVALLAGASAGVEVAKSSLATATAVIPVLGLLVEMAGGAAINVAFTIKALNVIIQKLTRVTRIMYGATLEAAVVGQDQLGSALQQALREVGADDAV
uniref:IRG-type G domain-containing protein n=1 Tax=Alexandrium catenella TaxID=2925 RepID=A0A7S1LHX5_ALECA|mmetsp:Transcript_113989/g.302960  ORF Transcript_113989/g.302960 Transcript_113989/m.302960 type:complete len:413 (+) Transcript_113989:53-1291(+)|eukprot:CAMPEP_0171206872 /NCGR_PEP_ID=MMETSP0790-20130122/27284_1 /TAXON_ID=2925 /ORGANISM="Alexandrium catenella, Strain OF101" /LENGTH=412 /DNA_ID=CAMNT_0011672425 /DNA_START=42 /DNA_END=1280 /DNA_ORIENTATION=-